ncbi:MAG: hypothetical protein WCD24_15245 [Serratia inhibens]|uniref:hypothetical protein n=1 Tax=Serratia TaxID=613 RepID=UPI001FD1DF81|nr:hypothetical protein [Serratia proteamaculans]CAI0927828.1 Uncharacterised protein [Serratia proteamaculans]CAI0932075.1 Uncharacterised protein [Serratia proteamaculans]
MTKLLMVLNGFLFLLFLPFSTHAEEPFKCTSQYKTLVEKDNDYTLFDGRLTLFLKDEHGGFFSLSGKVSTKEKNYLLARKSYFTLTQHEINQVKQATITKVIKHPSDTTPDPLWLADILPELPGIDFHIEIWRLKDNLMMVKSINTGYLICAKN